MRGVPITEGAYSHPSGRLFEVARHEDRTQGWLAYQLRDIGIRKDSDGNREVNYYRHTHVKPETVTVEFWLELCEFPLPEPELVSQERLGAARADLDTRACMAVLNQALEAGKTLVGKKPDDPATVA